MPQETASSATLTRKQLDGLLEYLNADRNEAGRQYEDIRRRLIRLFEWRGAEAPDELADETINRVARRIGERVEILTEDPFRYFRGVGYRVFQEQLRRREQEAKALHAVARESADAEASAADLDAAPALLAEQADAEERAHCLEQCLQALPEGHRCLIEQYYLGEKQERIRNRRRLAEELGSSASALRLRAHRIRTRLERCITERLAARGLAQ